MKKNNLGKYRLYGRNKIRSKKNLNLESYNNRLNKLKINSIDANKNNIMDIGSGNGESTIYLSKKYPKSNIDACENYINGNLNLINNIDKNNLKNIYLYNHNVSKLLDEINKKKYFNLVWIFFPDPWPKKKHFKRRLINDEFLKKIYLLLKDESLVYIITDSKSYFRSIVLTIYQCRKKFTWINQNNLFLNYQDYLLPHTKYYKKAFNLGIKPNIIILKKI